MTQPTLPGLEPLRAPGDDLERGYTPQPVADFCVELLARRVRFPGGVPRRIAEVHVGGGSWTRAIRKRWGLTPRVWVNDIDPDAPGLDDPTVDEASIGSVLDPVHLARFPVPDLVLGNPPFGPALEHLTAVREAWPDAVIAWILPWSRWALVGWRWHLVEYPPALSGALVPRPWPDIAVRDVGLFVWSPGSNLRGTTQFIDCHWRK